MSCWNKEELEQMLEDVVNELDLSDLAIEEHGPMGTPPAELVRLVLEQKDKTIRMLEQGMVRVSDAPKSCVFNCPSCGGLNRETNIECVICGKPREEAVAIGFEKMYAESLEPKLYEYLTENIIPRLRLNRRRPADPEDGKCPCGCQRENKPSQETP